MTLAVNEVLSRLDKITGDLTELYQDLHAHPELSFAEHRTAGQVAARLTLLGFEVSAGVGKTGVVGVLRNGSGPTVLLRADMDALPVAEQTGVPYASTATGTDPDGNQVPVMHACGHDMHVTCLLGALDLLAGARPEWSGTVIAVFQPAEETGGGAQAMVDDGLFERFGRPDIVLGQHVVPLETGVLAYHAGPAMAAADALRVRLFGKGAHGSMPEAAIDPVVMAAATVMRLQTVVSREVGGHEPAVVTVGVLRAGSKNNIIPDDAELQLNIRSYSEPVRARVLAAVERIVRAEATASGAEREPEISPIDRYPVLVNDPAATERTVAALTERFGAGRVVDPGPVNASEDVGVLATAARAPLVYWWFGGGSATGERDLPANHSPRFAPAIEPTVNTGVIAMVTAALAWLGPGVGA